jgi:hypothetical protein
MIEHNPFFIVCDKILETFQDVWDTTVAQLTHTLMVTLQGFHLAQQPMDENIEALQ